MNKQVITNLIYNASESEIKLYLSNCKDPEDLYVYAFNYNWGAGFDIPNVILSNPICTISTAKLIFFRADGVKYLRNKTPDEDLPEWNKFISLLYSRIVAQDFLQDNFQFVVPLSKVQKLKLKKEINKSDCYYFIDESDGENLDIEI